VIREEPAWTLNTDAHLRSSLIGRSESILIVDGALYSGEHGGSTSLISMARDPGGASSAHGGRGCVGAVMNSEAVQVGAHKKEIDTPALLLNLTRWNAT
jgi:hypothetical protein